MSYFEYRRIQDPDETETPLEVLGLSTRTYDRLYESGIKTIEELFGVTEAELLAIKQLGMKSFAEVKEKMGFYREINKIRRVFPRKVNGFDPLRSDEIGFCQNGESIFSNPALRKRLYSLDLSYKLREELENNGIETIDQLIVLSKEEICSAGELVSKNYLGILSKMRIYFIKNGISCLFPAEPAILDFSELDLEGL